MAIRKVAYGYVEHLGAAPNCALHTVSSDLEAYLEAHVLDLQRRAASGDGTPPASFRSTDAKQRMEQLLAGDDDAFLTNAQALAVRLQGEMDGRTRKGFFVALRVNIDGKQSAAVLKLDVQDKYAAAIERSSDEPDLEVVKELLDLPGDLQKGALYPDKRTESDLIIGDKLFETSLYFLRAIDAEQIAKPGPATGTVVRLVKEVAPERTTEVARALETEAKATTPKAFFQRHPDLLPDDQRRSVLDSLAQQRRPVRRIDPGRHSLVGAYVADGITIRGRITELADKVTVSPRKEGGWKIEIVVSEEPRLEPE